MPKFVVVITYPVSGRIVRYNFQTIGGAEAFYKAIRRTTQNVTIEKQ